MGNREDLIAGAKRCLAEKGYARTTVRDIAGAAQVSMAAIGYHFGSREALLNAAVLDALGELGEELIGPTRSARNAEESSGATSDTEQDAEWYQELWRRRIASMHARRFTWLASVEAVVQAEQSDHLRAQVADGEHEGRSGLVAELTGVDEQSLDPETVRTLGGVELALVSGVMMQQLVDPEGAPGPEDIIAGLRRLASIVGSGPS